MEKLTAKDWVKKEWSNNNDWNNYPPSENKVVEMVESYHSEKNKEIVKQDKELKELLHKCWIQAQKKLHDPLTEKGFKSFCDEHLKVPVKQDKGCKFDGKCAIKPSKFSHCPDECEIYEPIKQDKGIEEYINFIKDVVYYYEEYDIGDVDLYNKAKKLI
jgi:hypothetical protein